MELGSTEAVKEALMAGFGISILSRISIRRELAEGISSSSDSRVNHAAIFTSFHKRTPSSHRASLRNF
jgi:DNA-binding transcriptional LysR family regulator